MALSEQKRPLAVQVARMVVLFLLLVEKGEEEEEEEKREVVRVFQEDLVCEYRIGVLLCRKVSLRSPQMLELLRSYCFIGGLREAMGVMSFGVWEREMEMEMEMGGGW